MNKRQLKASMEFYKNELEKLKKEYTKEIKKMTIYPYDEKLGINQDYLDKFYWDYNVLTTPSGKYVFSEVTSIDLVTNLQEDIFSLYSVLPKSEISVIVTGIKPYTSKVVIDFEDYTSAKMVYDKLSKVAWFKGDEENLFPEFQNEELDKQAK